MPGIIDAGDSFAAGDILDDLPHQLVKSEIIPPAPNLTGPAIDFLPDFAGYGWLAYGAASLFVISHFPSPASPAETLIGPIMRQVFELAGYVNAVAWSPLTPCTGEVVVAAENRIALYSHDSESSTGSFGWSQSAVLVQATKVDLVKWTGSGDGIVAGGVEVVFWKNKGRSWEVVWKFRNELPQDLVSTTWSIEGPMATAAAYREDVEGSSSTTSKDRKCVSLIRSNEGFEYTKVDLRHPQPITMIQWRPQKRRKLDQDVRQSMRNVLMTCSVDGTVRLWCQVDNGKVNKFVKDVNDQQTLRQSFFVAAVIETNQVLKGSLGFDIYVVWATESQGMIRTPSGNVCFLPEIYGDIGSCKCEWIVGTGPGSLITFWAIHCLDDVTPERCPQVTLWQRQEVPGLDLASCSGVSGSNCNNQSSFNKIFFSRNKLAAPPAVCSLIHLFPGNSVHWSMLCATTTTPKDKETGSVKTNKNILSFQAHGILELGGHSGKILDVAVHSDCLNHHYAVSLDSKGKVLFWSLSTLNQCTFGLPMVNPSWKVCGELVIGSSRPKYTSILWAPSVVQDDFIVLMGNACGIDCYIVEFVTDEVEAVICHYICTLPCHVHHATGPRCISAIPFPSNYSQNSFNSTFILLGVWMGSFEALSWDITVHCSLKSKSSCGCEDGCVNISTSLMRFEHTMSGKKYCVLVDPCASEWPQLHAHDQITSAATVYTGSSNYSLPMKHDFVSDARYSGYHIATGYLDGTVKLWKSNSAKTLSPSCQWELVGAFSSDENPVSALSLTDCGRKIATVTTFSDSTTSMLRIWECMHLLGSGSVVLEHTIPFDNHVVALRWLASGSGQFLLGVCMPNKIQLFTQRRCGGQSLLGSQTKMQIWCCLATTHISPPVSDFVWGPGAAPLIIHDYYFSLLEPWVYKMDTELQTNNSCSTVGEPISHWTRKAEGYYIATFTDNFRMNGLKESSMGEISRTNHLECLSGVNLHSEAHMKLRSRTSILELADKLIVPLPVYHPESLIANIFSGNWKRARFALRFLIKYFATEGRSSKMKFALPATEILLSDYFEGQEVICSSVKEQWWSGLDGSASKAQLGFSAFAFGSEYDVSHLTTSSPDSELSGFNEQMEMLQTLGYMTEIEKLQTCSIMDLLNEISGSHSASVYGSLDEPGRRFWVAVRFQMLLTHKKSGQLPSTQDLMIDSKTICWAFHSDCQENLFSSLLPNEASWSDMRAIGFGFWFTDAKKLRTKMEKLARFQYLKNKDPKSCALLYIALNRVQVLVGLFKISKDEKDKPLVGFLSRNFQEENNKAAALKNAYVLMGRHQLELAIAFFLLGGDTSSAVTVCAKNLRDEQLALVICRLTEGPGGPMKRHLVSSYLLPTAVEKGDSWLQSLFEWENGNYSQSFLAMLGTQRDSKSIITSSSISFLDPSIGQYCMLLASKNSLQNAVGEQKAAVLSKWATQATATALNRSGLPLEGLESLSSSHFIPSGIDQEKSFDTESVDTFSDLLQLSVSKFPNWLSGGISCYLESQVKLELASKYFSNLMKEHPNWPENYLATGRAVSMEDDICQYDKTLKTFLHKLHSGLGIVERKFALSSSSLVDMMVFSLCNNRLCFMACTILLEQISQEHFGNLSKLLLACPGLSKLFLKSAEEISVLVSRFTLSCSVTCFQPLSSCSRAASNNEIASIKSDAMCFCVQDLVQALRTFRSSFQIYSSASVQDFATKPFLALDFLEFCIYFAAAWLQKNVKGLILLVQTFLISYHEQVPYEASKSNLKALHTDILELLTSHSPICDSEDEHLGSREIQNGEGEDLKLDLLVTERWQIIGACLWRQISMYMRHKLDAMSENAEDPSSAFHTPVQSESADDSVRRLIKLVSNIMIQLLGSILEHFSSYHAKLLGSLLFHKLDNQQDLPTLDLIGKCIQSQSEAVKPMDSGTPTLGNEDELWDFGKLWNILVDVKIISEGFVQENINLLQENTHKPLKRWNGIHKDIQMQFEKEASHTQEQDLTTASNETGSAGGFFRNGPSFFSSRRQSTPPRTEYVLFESPKEIYKRNGELFEAVCVNSIDQRQAALASNKKGILFFQWDDGSHVLDQREIWSEADWPQHGYVGSSFTSEPWQIPSDAIGSKSVIEAAGGASSPIKFGSDLGHGKGYRSGWDVEDRLIDPPATVNNIISRAFSSHPCRPFFLVGSANTHIYLWEFGKDRATATYGVLPVATVSPPYAIPSISALKFDVLGHRFATAALDGTINAWQLEVGGRSNILPSESLPCFESYASDITYITASGSIVAASGYGSDGFNAVIWDTMAPPSTSRASIRCHEGGAHSIAVFDTGIGSGSLSPLIVTGGKEGDIGLHDFRYVATGKMKRNKTSSNTELDPKMSRTNSPRKSFGEQNASGMLWYMPKAHIGSVTKIAVIPNTSLFLTGSKDGDVKLWDAQKSRLVFHWQKMHERHTFLQPSTRGYSSVVQAAVTDIHVVTHGFLTCGGDGSVKFTQLKDQ